MFMTIGKYWVRGVLPYSGLWDSKGPIIFGINALGYLITDSKTGIFLIEIICLLLMELIIYRMLRMSFPERKATLLTVLILFIGLLDYTCDSTEEFLMPLLFWCFYLMYKEVSGYSPSMDFIHNSRYAFVYGITFAFCLLTRLTNALGLCGGILVITLFLIIKKNWRNLLQNIVGFLLGATILILPFVLYFYSKGILYDAIYGTFLYNLDYAANTSSYAVTSLSNMILTMIGYSGGILLTAVGIFEITAMPNRRFSGIVWIAVSLLTLGWLVRSNGYLHYGLIELPYVVIALDEIEYSFQERRRFASYRVIHVFCVVLLIGCCIGSFSSVKSVAAEWYNRIFVREVEAYRTLQSDMLKEVPEEEKSSLVAYNTNCGFYLQHNIKPCYRFFTLQDWAASRSTSLTKMLKRTFQEGQARWILVSGDPDKTLIADTLQKRYKRVDTRKEPYTENQLNLYRLADR